MTFQELDRGRKSKRWMRDEEGGREKTSEY